MKLLSLLLALPVGLFAGVPGSPYSPTGSGASGSATNVSLSAGTAITIGTNSSSSWSVSVKNKGITTNLLDDALYGMITNASTAGTVGKNLSITNPTFKEIQADRFLTITNYDPFGVAGGSNRLCLYFTPSDKYTGIVFEQADTKLSTISFWPKHNGIGDTPELIFTSQPGSLCYYYDFIQWGDPVTGPYYEFHEPARSADYSTGTLNTNLGVGYTHAFLAQVYTNTAKMVYAGSLSTDKGVAPTIQFRATSTNGSGAWCFFDNYSYNALSGATPNKYFAYANVATERLRITVGPDASREALTINGGIKINGAYGLTTNYTLTAGDVLSVSNGIVVSISTPAPYAIDSNVASYISAIGGTTPTISNALQTLVTTLKTDGSWTNFDAFYPFAASSAASNGFNLVRTGECYIAWTGAFTTNNEIGVIPDGSTGYGDAHWSTTNGLNCGAFVMCKTNFNDTKYLYGWRYDTGSDGGFNLQRSGSSWRGIINSDNNNGTANFLEASPWAVYIGRTNSTDVVINWMDGVTPYRRGEAALEAKTAPNYNAYVCAANKNGSAYAQAACWIQFFGLGGGHMSLNQFSNTVVACQAFNTALGR